MWVIADSIRLTFALWICDGSDRIGIRSDHEVDDVSDVVCVCVTVCVCRRVERAYRTELESISFLVLGSVAVRCEVNKVVRLRLRARPDRRGRRRRTHVGAPATARGVATVGGGACAPCTGRDRPLKSSKKRPEKDTTGHVDASSPTRRTSDGTTRMSGDRARASSTCLGSRMQPERQRHRT